jgi:biopolymer transport protein ExbB
MLLVGPAQAWWNKDWPERKKIVLDTSASGVPIAESLTQVSVLVRLHSGNFHYFLHTQADGADLRFIASDDKTPLHYHIEQYDQLSGLANVWVQVPTLAPGSADAHIWMYYGNPKAPPAQDPAGTYDAATALVYHYAERSGLPRDASAFANHPSEGNVRLGQPGVVDLAAAFDPAASLRIAASPTLSLSANQGFTLSTWLKLTQTQPSGKVFTLGSEESGLRLEVADNHLVFREASGGRQVVARTTAPLAVDRWYHVAATSGAQLKLYLDGALVAEAENPNRQDQAGDLLLGATTKGNGFTGLLDGTQIASVERSADWIQLTAKGQGPDGKLVVYGEDQTVAATGGFGQFALIKTLARTVSVDGWAIIAVTLALGFLAFDAMVTRYALVRRVEKLDTRFAAEARELVNRILKERDATSKQRELESIGQTFGHSALFRLFQTGIDELDRLLELAAARGRGKTLAAEGLEVIRSSLDATMIEESNRLNARMVLVTIAISGAPFLGLLGTVMGVMMTFATVAATGDVNVNTIAPGVASAMATTVVGLVIAIPCMFGYNYLATLISKRMSAMEVYADQLVGTLAMAHSSTYAGTEASHATQNPTEAIR